MAKKIREIELTDWSKSKPPMVGEYMASTARDMCVRRWWDGKMWSVPYYPLCQSVWIQQEKRRVIAQTEQRRIEWRGLAEKPDYPFPPGPLEKL